MPREGKAQNRRAAVNVMVSKAVDLYVRCCGGQCLHPRALSEVTVT